VLPKQLFLNLLTDLFKSRPVNILVLVVVAADLRVGSSRSQSNPAVEDLGCPKPPSEQRRKLLLVCLMAVQEAKKLGVVGEVAAKLLKRHFHFSIRHRERLEPVPLEILQPLGDRKLQRGAECFVVQGTFRARYPASLDESNPRLEVQLT